MADGSYGKGNRPRLSPGSRAASEQGSRSRGLSWDAAQDRLSEEEGLSFSLRFDFPFRDFLLFPPPFSSSLV